MDDTLQTDSSHKGAQSRSLRWLLQRARPVKLWIGLSIGAGFAGGLLLIAQAWLLARMVSAVFMNGRPLAEAAIPMALFIGVVALRAVMAWAREVSGFHAGAAVRAAVRQDLLHQLARLGPAFTARSPGGALASAAIEQVEALQPFFARYLPQLALAALIPGAILGFVFPLSWAAAALLLVSAPLIPLFMVLVGMGAESISQKHFQALSRLSGHFLDLLRGLTTIKLFGRSQAAAESVRQAAADYRHRTMAVLKIAFLSSAVLEFFTSMAIALVAVYLGMSYLGYLDFGAYGDRLGFVHGFFILLLAPEFFFPLRELGQHYHARAEAIGASEELLRILSQEPMSVAANAGGKAPIPGSDIRFASVNLSYGGARQGALTDVRLDIPFGQHTVIVGESGAGKTSLFNLLLGFVAPDSGRVLAGGTPLPLLDLAAWRRQVAWIGQQPVLFYGTIADNVRLGRPAATDVELRTALERAGAWPFVQRLPRRLDTPIGEQGLGLSRGQAQRVALARVFLRGAPVLLLDEPLSSLDMETERQVATAIADFARGRTLIMLTHRLDAVRGADRVVVMDGGTVSFQGTPAAFDAYRRQPSAHTSPEAAP